MPFLPPRRPLSPRQHASDEASALISSVTRLARNSISSFQTPRPSFISHPPSTANSPAAARPLFSPSAVTETPKTARQTVEMRDQSPGDRTAARAIESTPEWAEWKRGERKKLAARVVSRTVVTAVCTAAAILIPGFERVMGFMGNFSAFLICIILPVSQRGTLSSRCLALAHS